MSSIYPAFEYKSHSRKPLYYVEFERGGKTFEFTLFKRQWIMSEELLKEEKEKFPQDFPMLELCNEGHPWNIFTAEFGPDGCMPDKAWVCWMVDSLNKM